MKRAAVTKVSHEQVTPAAWPAPHRTPPRALAWVMTLPVATALAGGLYTLFLSLLRATGHA